MEGYSEAELNEPGLRIKSPHIQRVIVKWVEELKRVLTQAKEVIPENKNGFKSSNGNFTIHLTTSRKEELSRRISDLSANKFIPSGLKRRRRLLEAINEVLALSFSGIEGYVEMPHD